MSMISAQIDELRQMADGQATYRDARAAMLQAADTICELRDDLQRANAENDKLRNEVDSLMDFEHLTSVAVAYAGCDECGEYKQIMFRLFAENAKLRELVRALLTCATEGECDECRMNGATPWHVGNAQLCDEVWEHLRELGVEVD